MIITIVRTILIYFFAVVTLRLMGKRQIGELEASELVVTIMISEIAALPITDPAVPFLDSILAIVVLLVLEILLSYGAYRSARMRTVLYGKPSMFYRNGKLNQKEMRRQRFNVADLMEELRNRGAVSLDQAAYVLMETNGNVSVILKSEQSPVTPQDMEIKTDPVRMSYVLVDNGNLIHGNMRRLGLNDAWLDKVLKEAKLSRLRDIFYLSMEEESGKTVLIPQERKGGQR